jgi:hypothetical protein
MERVKVRNGSKWKKGMAKRGGRRLGTPNKVTAQLKHAIIEAAAMVGYNGEGEQGLHGYLARLALKEPAVFGRMLEKLLPMQLQGKLDGEVKHTYKTVEDLRRALKERGLPIPPKIVDLTPREYREVEDG